MEKDPKLRPLYLAQILYERTDEDHYLTTAELMEILERSTASRSTGRLFLPMLPHCALLAWRSRK